MNDTALVEIGTAVMAVAVFTSIAAAIAYVFVAAIEEGRDEE